MIEDNISTQKILLTENSISNGFKIINFNDVTDFSFSHTCFTINGSSMGGVFFAIISNKIEIIYKIDIKDGTSYNDSNINKLYNLFSLIKKKLITSFIFHAIDEIKKNGYFKTCKLIFKKDGVYMKQKVFLGYNVIYIPYSDAEIEGHTENWGVFYSGGTSPLLVLRNKRINKTYIYSKNISHQPNFIEIEKAEELLYHIISNKIF